MGLNMEYLRNILVAQLQGHSLVPLSLESWLMKWDGGPLTVFMDVLE